MDGNQLEALVENGLVDGVESEKVDKGNAVGERLILVDQAFSRLEKEFKDFSLLEAQNHVIALIHFLTYAVELAEHKGWLLIYHHVKRNKKNNIVYTARAVLLDLENPSKVIAKTPYDILKPEEEYEIKGDVDNVVFPTGTIIKKGTLFVYYGAADKKIALATIELNKLLKELLLEKRCQYE